MISVQTTGGLGRRMEVAVPATRVQQEIEQRLRKIGRTVRLDGFRPGKAPYSVIRQRFGSQIRSEVVNELVQKSFVEAVMEQKLQPAGGPHIEPVSTAEGEDLKYTATFEVYPEIQLRGLDSLQIERPVVEVQDADIEETIEHLRKQWGEVKKTTELPAIDEEFCKALGLEGGVEALRHEIGESLKRQVDDGTQAQVKTQLLDALMASNPLDVPKALVDSQISDMQVDYARRSGVRDISQIPPRENFEQAARRRVTLGLLINEIIKTEKIEADRSRVQARLQALVANAPNPEESLRNYQQNAEALRHVEALVLEEQVVDWLLSRANVAERHRSFKDFSQPGS